MASQRCPALEEQENGAAGVPFWQRASSVPANKRPVEISARYTGSAGSVNDEAFQKAFLEVPTCDIFSAKQLKEKIAEQCAILQNVNNDWSKRMNALKLLRSVVLCGGLDYSDFTEELRDMQLALLNSVKDLRSQVCREGCVTIAFYCERLDVRMLGIVDGLMPTLISLLQNSAKVMATSANVALKYVVRYIRCPKLLPHFQAAVLSKSRDIRRNVAVLLMMVLTVWDSKIIEKYMSIFTDCVKGFLNDPDPEARNTGRDMFMQLSPDCKQQLYKSLDPSKQRALSGYLSQSSSSQSIVSERDNITHRGPAHTLHRASPSYYSGRSTSDIDQGAARRATSRARFPGKWSVPLQQVNGNAALSSMRTLKPQRFDSQKNVSVASVRRAAVPTTNYIRSQPGSRSTSPSSRAAPTRLPPRIGLSTNNKMRSQIEDLPDHATDSNESVRFDAVELTTALSSCSSSSLAERKDGLKALHNILSNAKEINKHDVKKISERLSVLIGESSYKLLQPLSDVVISFVRRYNHELNDWLHTLVPKLVIKQSNDMLPSNQEKFLSMLDAIRQSFDPEKQLLAICKFVQDPVRNNVTYKAKQGLLDYMVKLLESMDVWKSMNQSEVRQAINKIFQWTSDPKYSGLICLSEKIVCDMFNLNASSFTSMIATYPNDLKDRLQEIVRKNLSSRDRNGNMSSSTSAHAGILETTAQITELVDRLTISSPARGLPKYQSTPRRPSNENIAHHWFAREESIGSLSGYVLDSQNFADDLVMQEEVICKIGEELSLHNQRNAERMRAMAVLSHITRDNLFALWEKHFKMIFLLLIETLKDNDADIRRMALKLLKEICYSQASRFNHFAEMALIRVLDACTDEAKFVVTAAEDCGNVLATHVSSAICRRVLLAVIKSDVDEAKIHIAIKMLTKVIESLCVDELISIIDEITPPIIATYNYENSSIRKESVICLVAMISIVGEEIMAPYISKLNKGKQKLIDVYLQRMKKPTPAA